MLLDLNEKHIDTHQSKSLGSENIKLYGNILEYLNRDEISENIDLRLREPLREVMISSIEVFGDLVDWDKVSKILKYTEMKRCNSETDERFGKDPSESGYWLHFYYEFPEGNFKPAGKLVVREYEDEFEEIRDLAHEIGHMLCEDIDGFITPSEKPKYAINGIYFREHSEEPRLKGVERAINDGAMDVIGEMVIENYCL